MLNHFQVADALSEVNGMFTPPVRQTGLTPSQTGSWFLPYSEIQLGSPTPPHHLLEMRCRPRAKSSAK